MLSVVRLGQVEYSAAMALMEQVWSERCQDQVPDTLLLLEHPPVITFGVNGGEEDLRAAAEVYARRHIALATANRGGRATFHGPGQLVAYPVIKLNGLDLHSYLWRMEETAIRLLKDWGISSSRDQAYPGVWVGERKIAAVGMAVRQGVTSHGIALNVNVDLSFFQLITPCGITGRTVTSMQQELGEPLLMTEVEESFLTHFRILFGCEIISSRFVPTGQSALVGG